MLKTLAAQIKQYKRSTLLTPLFTVLEVVMEVLIPFVTAAIIDKGINAGDISKVYIYGGIMLVMAFMSLLTLALMANLAYKDEGWRKGMLDSEKAFRLGRPLLMFYRLFLAFGILAEIVPGMAALISDNSGILISMFMTTYPVTLWKWYGLGHGEHDLRIREGQYRRPDHRPAEGRTCEGGMRPDLHGRGVRR